MNIARVARKRAIQSALPRRLHFEPLTLEVLDLIRQVRNRGLPVILISHNMPQVFELADRVHIQRLGRRVAVIRPQRFSMSDAVAIMTGAMAGEEVVRE